MPTLSTFRIVAASLLAAAGLVIVGWFDYDATRAELLGLLRGQAETLRQTVAAAARSNEAAGAVASKQVTERLLDNARLLAEIDRKGGLTQAFLDDIAGRNRLFRVTVFAADGSRENSGGGPGGPGAGAGPGGGAGFQWGRGSGGAGGGPGGGAGGALAQRLLTGDEREAVGQVHAARWGGGSRVSAGVRRAGGGAIVLNADASEVEALQRQASIQTLLHDIGSSTPQLAYILIERGTDRVTHGDLPADLPPVPEGAEGLTERPVQVAGEPLVEFAGAVSFGAGEAGTLRLGLRLDELRRAERRMLTGWPCRSPRRSCCRCSRSARCGSARPTAPSARSTRWPRRRCGGATG